MIKISKCLPILCTFFLVLFQVSNVLSQKINVTIKADGYFICPGEFVTINSTVTNADGFVIYFWETPEDFKGEKFQPSIEADVPGTYRLMVESLDEIDYSNTETINQFSGSLTVSPNGGDYCEDGNKLILSATSSGVAQNYAWNVPQGFTGDKNSQSITANAAGLYSVNAQLGFCNITSAPVPVTEKSTSLSISSNNPTTSGSSNGVLSVNVSNGKAPYSWQYSKNSEPAVFGNANSEPFNITSLSAGNYVVTVSDADNCPSSRSAALTNPSCELSFVKDIDPPTCHNGTDGLITVVISNGPAPYTISWTGPVTDAIITNSTKYTILNLPSGSYNIKISDAAGCDTEMNAIVSNTPPISVAIVGDLVFCDNEGGTTLSTSAASFSTFLWSNGTTGPTLPVSSSGNYSVTVTNSAGCTANSSVVVTELPPLNINLNSSASNLTVTCQGDCDGAIFINVSGGSAKNYVYNWSGPGGYSSNQEDISGLCSGNYSLTVVDSEGCMGMFSVSISSPAALLLGLSSTDPTCNGFSDGTITTTFSGGVSPYSISWSGAGSGTNTSINSPHTISGLVSGSYSLTLTDSNGCTKIASETVNATSPFTFNAAELSPSCQGSNTGSILVSGIANGSAPYTITWSLGGSEDSDITASTSYTIDVLISGSYTIIVKDSNGCDHSISSVIVGEQSQINVEIVGDIVLCSDQDAGVLTTNPTSFTTWNWSTGSNDVSISITDPGTYSVTVTDAGGCTGENQVAVSRASDILLSTDMASSNLVVSCDGDCDGKLVPNISGGNGPYSFSWTGPSGFVSNEKDIENLCAGNYALVVTDISGCKKSYSQEISNSSSLEIDLDPTSASCSGEADGSITSKVIGGTSPYSYSWSNGGNTQNITDLLAGTYSVTVTDDSGCTASSNAVVGEAAAINGMITPSNGKICIGENIDIKASGGVSYLWSTGETNSSITVSPPETTEYSVTITGTSISCSVVKIAKVTVNDLSGASILIAETSGLSNNDGEICAGNLVKLNATGGVSYMWQGGVSNPLEISPESTDTYSVTITDAEGCKKVLSESIVVNKNPKAAIDLSDANQILGDVQLVKNGSDAECGSLTDCEWTIDNNTSAISCSDQEFTFDELGSYEIGLEVENACGCTDEAFQTIDIVPANGCRINLFSINNGLSDACVNQAVQVEFDNIPTEGCAIASTKIQVRRNGMLVDNYSFVNGFITFFEEGVYEVRYEIEDDCTCSRFVTREVRIFSAPDIEFADVNFLVGCAGEAIAISLAGFEFGEKVAVNVNGVVKVYETDKFNVFLNEPGSYDVSIISVSNQFCEVEISGQKLTIQIIEPLRIDQKIVTCDDDGTYSLTLVTSGGQEGVPIQSSLDGIQNGNNFIINDLDPNFGFQFNVWRGSFCELIAVTQPIVSCNCLFNQGELEEETFISCAGDFFDISNVYIGTDENNPLTDTLLYFLHDGEEINTLGKVYAIYPITQMFISNDFLNYTPNQRYVLSVVGIRKFDFSNLGSGEFSLYDYSGQEDCFSVSKGVPVIWHGSEVDISGPNQVCENAYNEIFVSSGIGDGAEIDILIPGLTSENYTFDQTDGKLYVHFVNGTNQSVPLQVTSTTKHQDLISGEIIQTTCVSAVDYDVTIDQAHASPDTSRVLLWPGGIFASVDTSENICYRWGKTTRVTNSVVRDSIFAGANDRFYYADFNDVEGLNERRQIWVETFFCDDSLCATRNIYNGLFPISLGVDLDESGMTIYPNPSDGLTNFTINNKFIGGVEIVIYDIQGRQIVSSNFNKTGFIRKKTLDLEGIPSGMYIVQIVYGNEISFIEKLIKH